MACRWLRANATAEAWNHLLGDHSSYCFHAQAKVQHPATMVTLLQQHDPLLPPASATFSSVVSAGAGMEYASSYFSSDSPCGLFRERDDVSADAQSALLAAVDRCLPPSLASQAEGPAGDSSLSGPDLLRALKGAKQGSCPGYDGLPFEFFRAFDSILVPLLLRVFNSAFADSDSAAPLAHLLSGVVCLVRKPGQSGEELAGYRPITLLNSDVKLVMLVIADRLHLPLDYLIDISQSAFLRGRDISDNVRYHLGLASRLEELGLPGWLLLSDLAKAYDRVDRSWLDRTMVHMGFTATGVVRWTRILLNGSVSKVRVNGFLSAPVPVRSSLAQGAPISCQEWVIVLQPLMSYLNSLQATGRLSGAALPSGALLPATMAYADDTKTLVLDPERDGTAVRDAFRLFQAAGGPAQSLPKSHLLHLAGPAPRAPAPAPQELAPAPPELGPAPPASHGYSLVPLGTSRRLLGIPFSSDYEACTSEAFANMPAKLRQAAALWDGRHVNLLGRAHIAGQCLASKLVYQAGFFPPPALLLKEMQSTLNQFVASSDLAPEEVPYPTKLYPRAAVSHLPVGDGGLGLPVLSCQCQAMLAKSVWLCFRHSSHPWVELFRHVIGAARAKLAVTADAAGAEAGGAARARPGMGRGQGRGRGRGMVRPGGAAAGAPPVAGPAAEAPPAGAGAGAVAGAPPPVDAAGGAPSAGAAARGW